MSEERRTGLQRRLVDLGGRRAGDQQLAGVIAERFVEGIRRKQLTIRQAADLAGLNYRTVVEAMRSDVDPKLSTLIALSAVLEIPLAELVKPSAA